MSRSGYVDDCDMGSGGIGRWRGAVASSIRGKRGQRLLREMVIALEGMPVKELIKEQLLEVSGQRCALGVLGEKRGISLAELDPEDYENVAYAFDIAPALAQEIVYENDDRGVSVKVGDE